jgi:hypothetical protein
MNCVLHEGQIASVDQVSHQLEALTIIEGS